MASHMKKAEKKEEKVETKFYDELFKRLADENSEEFKDPEAVGQLTLLFSFKLKNEIYIIF